VLAICASYSLNCDDQYHRDWAHNSERYAPPPRGVEYDPLASRTLSFAKRDSDATFRAFPDAPGNGGQFIRFIDSGGAGLKDAERALFNRSRPAQERFQ
jgi:hypothetical protein